MNELLKGVTSGGWTLLAGWLLPTALSLGFFATVVAPELVPGKQQTSSTEFAILLGLVIGLALTLAAIRAPLYRLLEGYLWPLVLRRRGIARQRRRADLLKAQLAQAHGLERALLNERLARFPIDPDQYAPTGFGNSIRAFETYAFDRYRMDSQLLWGELEASVPDVVVKNLQKAEAGVDFFVCLIYVQALLIGTTLSWGLRTSDLSLAVVAIVVLQTLLLPAWYASAVASVDQWRVAVQALCNLGRKPLAEALGFDLPDDFEQEREFWRRINWLVRRPYNSKLAPELSRYRNLGKRR